MSRPPRHTIRRDPWRQPCGDSPRSGKAWRTLCSQPVIGRASADTGGGGGPRTPTPLGLRIRPERLYHSTARVWRSPIRCASRSFSCCLVRVAPAILAAEGLATPALMASRPLHDRCRGVEIRPGVVAGRHAAGAFSASRVASGGGELQRTCGNAPTSSRTRIRSPIY
jgi:hypothetical protein